MITQQVLDYLSTLEIQTEVQPWPREAELASVEAKILNLMEAYQADILRKEDVFPAVAQLRGTARTLRHDVRHGTASKCERRKRLLLSSTSGPS